MTNEPDEKETREAFLLKVLEMAEWTNLGEGDDLLCPVCFQVEGHGHASVQDGGWREPCPLGVALGRDVRMP